MHHQASSRNEPIPRDAVPELRKYMHDWLEDLDLFRSRYPNRQLTEPDPVYALPAELLECLRSGLADWLSEDEVQFERDFLGLCCRHGCLGVFHRLPIPFGPPPPAPQFSDDVFRLLGWDRDWTLNQARRLMSMAPKRLDPLRERLDAYRGWLVTNPQFLKERDRLRARWDDLVRGWLRRIPQYPVRTEPGGGGHRSPGSRDVTDEFIGDFNTFFERWRLRGMGTWDLPEPEGSNLSGLAFPADLVPAHAVSVQLSPISPMPANFPLRAMIEEAQRAQTPPHLKGWLDVQRQPHASDLRFTRFRRMFLLHLYRDAALAGRYAGRFAGKVEALDRAFGCFLGGVGEDSVKKLRQSMAALRRVS